MDCSCPVKYLTFSHIIHFLVCFNSKANNRILERPKMKASTENIFNVIDQRFGQILKKKLVYALEAVFSVRYACNIHLVRMFALVKFQMSLKMDHIG